VTAASLEISGPLLHHHQGRDPAAGDAADQVKSQNIFDFSHRKPRLGHHFAPLGVKFPRIETT
jgi:hypothetical protein